MKHYISLLFSLTFICNINGHISFGFFNNYFKKQLEAEANFLIGDKASQEDEAFVRNIAKEMKIDKPFNVYYMNQNAIKIATPINAIMINGNMVLGPYYLNVLSESEKRFLIGHELGHLKRGHNTSKLIINKLTSVLYLFAVGLYFKKFQKVRTSKDSNLVAGCSILTSLSLILFPLFHSRCCEYEADEESVVKLNEYDGGISWMKNHQKHYTPNSYPSKLAVWFSTHPSFAQRIERIEALKKEYIKKQKALDNAAVVK